MSSKLEDQVWEFIAKHRPLKLIFLTVAGVGIVGSAIKTMEPVWLAGTSLADRYLGLAPTSEIRERYGCAFQTGQAYWAFSRVTMIAMKEPKPEPFFSNISTQEIARCEVIFGFTPIVPDITAKALNAAAPNEVLKEHFAVVTNNWNQFQAFLITKDRKAALLLRIGSELAMAKNGLLYFQSSDPKGFLGPLSPDLQEDTVKKLETLLSEAQADFPYRLPEPRIEKSSGAALYRSLLDLDARYVKYFRGEA